MKTYAEYLTAGYKPGAVMYNRGYISRKINIMNQPVLTAGGQRAGQLYINAPCNYSTRYHYRIYLLTPDEINTI